MSYVIKKKTIRGPNIQHVERVTSRLSVLLPVMKDLAVTRCIAVH